jgi:hypothetical protein
VKRRVVAHLGRLGAAPNPWRSPSAAERWVRPELRPLHSTPAAQAKAEGKATSDISHCRVTRLPPQTDQGQTALRFSFFPSCKLLKNDRVTFHGYALAKMPDLT